MVVHGLRKRAEDDAELTQLCFKSRRDRYAVENGVDGDTRQVFLLLERNSQLLVSLE